MFELAEGPCFCPEMRLEKQEERVKYYERERTRGYNKKGRKKGTKKERGRERGRNEGRQTDR